jgi:hypothetical protein
MKPLLQVLVIALVAPPLHIYASDLEKEKRWAD